MSEYFTWAMLATYSGAILAVALITQFIKGLGFIDRIPTRVTAYFVAVVVMIAALIFTGSFSWSGLALTFINAVVVSLAANGTHDALAEHINIPIIADVEEDEDEKPPDAANSIE